MTRRTSLVAIALALVGGSAFAQNQPPKPAPAPAPAPTPAMPKPAPAAQAPKPATQTQMAAHTPTHKVREASPGLLKQAKITPDAAEQTALGAVPGGTVSSRMIMKEKGTLVYVFNIKTSGKEGYDRVTVDANTGSLVANTHHTGSAKKGTSAPKKPA
jgi:hypothetical protein